MNADQVRCVQVAEAEQGTDAGQGTSSLTGKLFNLHGFWRSFRKKRGAAAVEFALVAPLFLLLVFGMLEFGRCVLVQQLLTNASREGARRAVLDGATTQDVVSTVSVYLSSASVHGASVTISPDPPSTAPVGQPVTVSVQVPYREVSWIPAPQYLGNATLSATSVMRRETIQ